LLRGCRFRDDDSSCIFIRYGFGVVWWNYGNSRIICSGMGFAVKT
jgi:hypothetical protein